MAGASSCRSSAARWKGRRALARGLSAGDLRAAACGHARGPVAGGSGGLAQRPAPSSPPDPTWSPSFPASGPSSTATIRITSPGSSPRAWPCSVPQRCLFGSNFPIEKLWTRYADLLDAHLQASAGLTPAERKASSAIRRAASIGSTVPDEPVRAASHEICSSPEVAGHPPGRRARAPGQRASGHDSAATSNRFLRQDRLSQLCSARAQA